jgi:peroxiredoxin
MTRFAGFGRARRQVSSTVCGVVLGALLLAAGATISTQAQEHPRGVVGQPAPAFALKDFQHRMIRLSQYRGKVVLLNFWASWCAPCLLEMPRFAQWQSQYHGKLQVVGVSMDDDVSKAEAAARKLKINYPVVMGTAEMGNRYGGVYGMPVSFVIDAEGRVRAEYQGGNHVKEIQAEIEHLLAGSGR